MGRIIAMVILAMVVFAACGDDDATGPTATSGEAVEFTLLKHHKYIKWAGEGYIFATCEKFVFRMDYHPVLYKLDIGFTPGFYPNPDIWVCTSGRRIYREGEEDPISGFYIDYGRNADFILVTLDGKARYKIVVSYKYVGANEERTYSIFKVFMWYRLLSS